MPIYSMPQRPCKVINEGVNFPCQCHLFFGMSSTKNSYDFLLVISLVHLLEMISSYGFVLSCWDLNFNTWFFLLELSVTDSRRLSKLKKLKTLDLDANHFEVSIFQSLAALPSLRNLMLSSNALEGPFPIKGMFVLT